MYANSWNTNNWMTTSQDGIVHVLFVLLLHSKSKRHETKLMHPSSSSRAFQRDQDPNLKHPGLVDMVSTKTKQNKTNKQPSFIDRYSVSGIGNSLSKTTHLHFLYQLQTS
jgi:hypothetical protein